MRDWQSPQSVTVVTQFGIAAAIAILVIIMGCGGIGFGVIGVLLVSPEIC